MGYTHYFKQEQQVSDEVWDKFAQDVRAIVRAEKKTTPLKFRSDANHIDLNGVDEDSHENLVISKRPTEFSFCKTAQKPYDRAVIMVLALAEKTIPGFSWSSDGGDEAIAEGRKLLAESFPDLPF